MARSHRELKPSEIDRVTERTGASIPATTGDSGFSGTIESVSTPQDGDHWIYRPDERVEILRGLFLADGSPWFARFALLLGASVIIATIGLANNQPAAVIAAMVVAPLMTPVLGIAASVTLGLARPILRLGLIVVVASLGAVAISWIISASLVVYEVTPEGTFPNRTPPAGPRHCVRRRRCRHVQRRSERPLQRRTRCGDRRRTRASPGHDRHHCGTRRMGTRAGATLLYGINVLAIVLAAIVVLLATDFIRSPSLRNPTVAAAAVATLIIAIALVVPAWQNSRQINDEVTFAHQAEVAVEDWTSAHPTYRVVEEEITPGAVMLVVASPSAPAELDDLAGAVATEAFPQPTVSIEWVRSATITDATPTR